VGDFCIPRNFFCGSSHSIVTKHMQIAPKLAMLC
jgi:hypothetical protein